MNGRHSRCLVLCRLTQKSGFEFGPQHVFSQLLHQNQYGPHIGGVRNRLVDSASSHMPASQIPPCTPSISTPCRCEEGFPDKAFRRRADRPGVSGCRALALAYFVIHVARRKEHLAGCKTLDAARLLRWSFAYLRALGSMSPGCHTPFLRLKRQIPASLGT